MNNQRAPRIIALAATLLALLLLLLILFSGHLRSNALSNREWPPQRHSEIIFEPAEEVFTYVPTFSQASDNATESGTADDFGASDVTSDLPTQTSHNAVNAGHSEGSATPPSTQKADSPAKTNPREQAAGNRTPNPEDEKAAEARRQQRARQNIDNRLRDRFSGSGKSEEGKAPSNESDGSSTRPGKGSGSGLGMTPSVNQRPPSDKIGTIVILCTVAPDGSVVPGSARVATSGNSGEAGKDKSLRQQCVRAAYGCRFSRSTADTDNRPGTITFRWEDPAK